MNEAELERFETQAAEIVGAAKGLFAEFESRLAQALNEQRLTNAQARDDAIQLQKVLKEVVASSKMVVDAREREANRIIEDWKTKFQDLARTAGASQANAFGESLSAGLRSDIDKLSRATQAATGRLQWSSIASWAIGVGIAIPLTVVIGVWALLPNSDHLEPLRMRVAVALLEPCEIAGAPRVCFPIDDKPQLAKSEDGRVMAAVRGL